MVLYPTDWAGVVGVLESGSPARADDALARYDKSVAGWGTGDGGRVDDATLAEHQKFAEGLADRAAQLVRGAAPQLGEPVSLTDVDDDIRGPYTIPPRDGVAKTVAARGG